MLQDFSIGLALTFDAANANSAAQQSSQIFTDLETRLNSVGTAAPGVSQSFSDVGNSISQSNQSVQEAVTQYTSLGTVVDQTATQLGTFNESVTTLDTTSQTVTANLGTMNDTFTAGLEPIKSQGDALANIKTNLDEHNASVTEATTQQTNLQEAFSNAAVGISTMITSFTNLARSVRDYGDLQVKLEQADQKVSKAREALSKQQDKLQKLIDSGITSGKEYEQVQLDIEQAENNLSIQTEKRGQVEKRVNDAIFDFWVSLAPTILSTVGTVGNAMNDFKGVMDSVKQSLAAGGFISDLLQQFDILVPAVEAGKSALVTFGEGADAMALTARGAATAVGLLVAEMAAAAALMYIIPKFIELQKLKQTETGPKETPYLSKLEAGEKILEKQVGTGQGNELEGAFRTVFGGAVEAISPGYFADKEKQLALRREEIKIFKELVPDEKEATITESEYMDLLNKSSTILDNTTKGHEGLLFSINKSPSITGTAAIGWQKVFDLNLKGDKAARDHAIALDQEAKNTAILTDMLGKNVDVSNIDKNVKEGLLKIHDQTIDAQVKEQDSLIQLAANHGALKMNMLALIDAEGTHNTQLRESVAANIDYTAGLTDTTKKAELVSQGHLQAALSLEKFFDGLVMGNAEMTKERAGLEAYATNVLKVNNANELTIPQLKELITLHTNSAAARELDIAKWQELTEQHEASVRAIEELNSTYGTKLNPSMQVTQKQLEDLTEAAQIYGKAIEELNDASSLFKMEPFDIEFNVDEEYKDFFEDLNKGTQKELKLAIKAEAANNEAAVLLTNIAKSAIQIVAHADVEFLQNEANLNSFIDSAVKNIKELFKEKGKDPAINEQITSVINKMLSFKGKPDGWQQMADYFHSPEFISAMATLDPMGKTKLLDTLQGYLPPETFAQLKQTVLGGAGEVGAGYTEGLRAAMEKEGIPKETIDKILGQLDPAKEQAATKGDETGTAFSTALQNSLTLGEAQNTITQTVFSTMVKAATLTAEGIPKIFEANLPKMADAFVKPVGDAMLLFTNLTTHVQTQLETIAGLIQNGGGAITEAWTKPMGDMMLLWTNLTTHVQTQLETIAGLIHDGGGAITDAWTEPMGSIMQLWTDLTTHVNTQIGIMFDVVSEGVTKFVDPVTKGIGDIMQLFTDWTSHVTTQMEIIFGLISDASKTWVETETTTIGDIMQLFTDWTEHVETQIGIITEDLSKGEEEWNKDLTKAIGDMEKLFTGMVKHVEGVIEQITKAFKDGGEDWHDTVTKAVGDMEKDFTGMVQHVKGVVESINEELDKIKTEINIKVKFDTSGKPKGLDIPTEGKAFGADFITERGKAQFLVVGEGATRERVTIRREGEPGFSGISGGGGGGTGTVILNENITVVAQDGSYLGTAKVRRIFPNLESH